VASLQARHSRRCALSQGRRSPAVTPFTIPAGCDCTPTYFVDSLVDGKKVREPVGRNRKQALRRLRKVNVEQDEGSYEPPKDIAFSAFADEWYRGLQRPKDSTRAGYKSTIAYAKAAFGSKKVRQVTADDLARFLDSVHRPPQRGKEDRDPIPASQSTKAKHLRVIGAMFNTAVRRGYCARNPVERLDASHRPQPSKRESAYFEDDELPRIVTELDGLERVLLLLALKTGMRQDEEAKLTWANVDTVNALIRIRDGKTKAAVREVDLTPDVVELLGAWWAECGKPADDVLVFSTGAGPIRQERFTKSILYPALSRAGIDRVGPTGEKRTWHSLRHTYARIALEHGAPLFWLSRQLGHSSVQVTQNVYGHWSRSARKNEVEKLTGAFVV
jgi:integrase